MSGIGETSLSKSAKTLATTYSNATFNMTYTAPAGWSFTTPTPGATGVYMTVTSSSYTPTVFVGAYTRTDSWAAEYFGPAWCYDDAAWCFNMTPTQVPYLYFCMDTTYTDTHNHFSWMKVKYLDDHSRIWCDFFMQNSSYILYVSYSTSVTDYNLNQSVYFQHLLNLTWYSATLLGKGTVSTENSTPALLAKDKQVTFELAQRQWARIDAFNLQGQNLGTLYNNVGEGKISVSAEPMMKADQNILLRLQTEKNQSCIRMNGGR